MRTPPTNVKTSPWFSRLSLVLLVAMLAACGGGSADQGADESVATQMPTNVSGKTELDAWADYADSGQGLPMPTAEDEIEAQLGVAARLNRQELEAARQEANRRKSAAFGQATRKAFVDEVLAYRFFNTQTGAHFYTISEAERDQVVATLPQFRYEGPAFTVSATPQDGLLPVYRFLNTTTGVHLYTISEAEKAHILASLVGGVGLKPLYRFYRSDRGFHFYTASYQERDTVIDTACTYRYEGTAYYVLDAAATTEPPAAHINKVVMVVGDSLSQGYGVSINGNPYSFVSPGKVWTQTLASAIKTRTGHNCNRVVNVSIGGMRTDQGASRIQGWVNQHAPTHVIVALGTNDAWQNRSFSSMQVGLNAIHRVSQEAGSRVYVMDFAFYPKGTAYRQSMTGMYQQVATNNQSTYFSGSAGVPATSTYYHPDSVHLKDAAQPTVQENVWQALLPTL
jgi:lysophospholipase L1-like esterase